MKILVTGATGFLGKRVCKKLDKNGYNYLKTSLSSGIDLRDKDQTQMHFRDVKPDVILNCAAYVGGIQFGYKHPAEIFYNNLLITLNLFESARLLNVKRIINPISNCAYPAKARFFREDEFWDGELHESVYTYGFIRKASWVGAKAYYEQYGFDSLNLILSNMYGPEDHFEEERSHALGALIMKIVKAKEHNSSEVIVWGTGKPVREWLFVDDGADIMVKAITMKPYSGILNVGVGKGISVIEMAEIIKEVVGYNGKLVLDTSKPDGAPFKTVDGSRLEKYVDWRPEISIRKGIEITVDWYFKNHKS